MENTLSPKYAREPKVREITGLSKSTLQRLVKKSRFPAPIKLSSRLNLWNLEEVAVWAAAPLEYGMAQWTEEEKAAEVARRNAISVRMKAWHAKRAAEKAAAV